MKLKTALVLVLVMSCICTSFAQNLLKNPGFEQTGGGGEWSSNPADWWNYGTAGNQEGWAAQPNVGGTYGCAFQGWIDSGWAGIGQSVSVNMTNGNVFKFTVNLKCEENFTSSGEELWLELKFTANGSVVAAEKKSIYEQAKEPNGREWNTYSFVYTNTYDNVTIVDAVIGGGQFAAQGGDLQAVLFDNASLTQHKAEPSSTVTVFEDNFEGGTLAKWEQKNAGDWANSTNEPINGTRSLKNNNEDAVETYISAATSYNVNDSETTWRFTLKDDWGYDPSPTGHFYVWLMADSSNLGSNGAALANGYAVGMDYANNDDMIKLWRYKEGAMDQVLVASTVKWTKRSTNAIQVTRSKTGAWTLSISPGNTFDNLVSYGTALDTTYTASDRFGLYAVLSSARAGKLWMDDVLICQELDSASSVTITNPSQSYLSVANTTDSYPISGLAENPVGDMVYWKNAATLDSGSAAVTDGKWSYPAVNLNAGVTNVITVVASNTVVQQTVTGSDDASNYGGDWEDGENQGSGFNAWELEHYGGEPGYIIDTSKSIGPGSDIDVDTDNVSFGMYSFGNNWAGAFRFFADGPLTSGQVFSVDMAMNYLDGGRGFDLCAANKSTLINFHCADGQFKISDESSSLTWPNNGQGFRYSLSVEQVSDSDCRITISRSDGNEWIGTRSFSSPVAGIKFYAGGMKIDVTNTYQYLYVNNLELSSISDTARDQVSIYRVRGDEPLISITSPSGSTNVAYEVEDIALAGTASNVVGTMYWSNTVNNAAGTMAAGTTWSVASVSLAYGENLIQISGVNSNSEKTTVGVIVTREPPPPSVAITLPPEDTTVINQVSEYTLSGTAEQITEIAWTNPLTGGSGDIAASGTWGLTNAALGEGDNYFILSATNERGYEVTASDSASLSIYSNSWTTGMNGGEGFSAWQLKSASDVTYSVGQDHSGSDAWILSSENEAVAEAVRPLGTVIGKGDEIILQWCFPAIYNSAGVVFQNSDGEDLLAFFAKNDLCYVRHNDGVDEDTAVPCSTNGMNVSFVFNTPTSYVAKVCTITNVYTIYTTNIVTNIEENVTNIVTNVTTEAGSDSYIAAFKGNVLSPAAGLQQISSMKFWYYYEGVSGGGNYYVNEMSRREYLTRDYVMITREPSNMPSVSILVPTQAVTYVDFDVTNYTFEGTCNESTIGNLSWYNQQAVAGGTFSAALSWTQDIDLIVGTNTITITGTNDMGNSRSATVKIIRDYGGIYTNYPNVGFVYPEAGIHVNYESSSITVTGTCNDRVAGDVMLWNISQTSIVFETAAANWTVTNQALDVGLNEFYASVTNASVTKWAADEANNAVYDYGGWTNGSDGGTGLKGWNIEFSGAASNAITDGGDLGTRAWSLYAPTGDVITAKRMFDTRMREGDQLQLYCSHDALSSEGKGGFALVNNAGLKLMELYCEAGATNFVVADAGGYRQTSVPLTEAAMIRLNISDGTNYVLWISSLSGAQYDFVGGQMKNPLYGTFTANGLQLWNSGGGEGKKVSFNALNIYGGIDAAYTYIYRDAYPQRPIWINELHYANEGPETNVGVEVAGAAGESLSSYQLILYKRENPSTTYPLSSYSDIPNEQGGYGAVWIPFSDVSRVPSNGFALVYLGGTFTQLVNYVTWGSSVLATSGPASGVYSDFIGNETNDSPVGYSLQLLGMGTNYQAFTWTGPSPASRGRLNSGQFISVATNVTGTIPDEWWYRYFSPGDNASATTDNDGDGYDNKQEFLAGTDPTDGDSFPAFSEITQSGNGITLTFPTTPQYDYSVWWSTNLMNTNAWTLLKSEQAASDSISVSVTNDWTNAFFRMDVGLPGW